MPSRQGSRAASQGPRHSVIHRITLVPHEVPHLPLPGRPAMAALSLPSPRSQSFRLRICTCGGPPSSFPTPAPPRLVLEMGKNPAVPGTLAQHGALTCCGFGSGCLSGCNFLGAGWQEPGALRRFGADWPGRELRRAQSPKPAARLILPEKRNGLVGADTRRGGAGEAGREQTQRFGPELWGSGAGDQSRAPHSGPSHLASQERTPWRFKLK